MNLIILTIIAYSCSVFLGYEIVDISINDVCFSHKRITQKYHFVQLFLSSGHSAATLQFYDILQIILILEIYDNAGIYLLLI